RRGGGLRRGRGRVAAGSRSGGEGEGGGGAGGAGSGAVAGGKQHRGERTNKGARQRGEDHGSVVRATGDHVRRGRPGRTIPCYHVYDDSVCATVTSYARGTCAELTAAGPSPAVWRRRRPRRRGAGDNHTGLLSENMRRCIFGTVDARMRRARQ